MKNQRTKLEEAALFDFASKHRLRVQRDECGDPVISGRRGHLYAYSETELGVMILSQGNSNPRIRLWNSVRQVCMEAGMSLLQNGDSEGALSFNPANREHAKLAMRLASVRPKRQMSMERRQAQLSILEKARLARKSIRREGSEAFCASEAQSMAQTSGFVDLSSELSPGIEKVQSLTDG